VVFCLGVSWLGLTRPGYSAVRQTISELGPAGEKGRTPLAALNLITALGALLFAGGLLSLARQSGLSAVPAYLVGFYAVPVIGLVAFPSGRPLHNVFGLLQTVSFVGAPWTVASSWRHEGGTVVAISWIALAMMLCAIVLNLAPAFSRRTTTTLEPIYGIVQRAIFVTWHGWCAALGALLFARL
jgi:hypothetical protein